MPIGVPTRAPRKRPSRSSETGAPTCRHISPLFNNARILVPIRLGRLLQNLLSRCPGAHSQISIKLMSRTVGQIKAETSMPSRPGLLGARISSAMTGSVIGSFGSRQVAQRDNVVIVEFFHFRIV